MAEIRTEAECALMQREGPALEARAHMSATFRASGTTSIPKITPNGTVSNTNLLRGLVRFDVDTRLKNLGKRGLILEPGGIKARNKIFPNGIGIISRGDKPRDTAPPQGLAEQAQRVLDAATTCETLSTNPTMALTAKKYVSLAGSLLGMPIVCHASTQCQSGERCDAITGQCLDLGVYCEMSDHCAAGSECDPQIRRCVPAAQFACSVTRPCRPAEICAPQGTCVAEQQLVGRPCEVPGAFGPCRTGQWVRDGGRGVRCDRVVSGSPETCNGIDDDCNSQIDDGLVPRACQASASGVCRNGQTSCTGGGEVCEPGAPNGREICGNDVDEDCNGLLDDSNCDAHDEPTQDFGCGWMSANDVTVGGACASGHVRLSCDVLGPQDDGRAAKFTGWAENDRHSCRCKAHCGTNGANSGNWKIVIKSVPEARPAPTP